jgi:hypothetical protein
MSIEARQAIVNSHNIIFRTAQQRDDIVSLSVVQTQLVAFLQFMVQNGALFVVTAIKSDHSDDTSLCKTGPPYIGTHAHGWAIDCWPLTKPEDGAYMDASDMRFQHFLRLAEKAPYLHQIGLGGTAYTDANRIASGPTAFADGYVDDAGIWQSEDHIHFGVHA